MEGVREQGHNFHTACRQQRQLSDTVAPNRHGKPAAIQALCSQQSALTWNSSCALDISSSGVMMPSCPSSPASTPRGSGGSAAGSGSGAGGGYGRPQCAPQKPSKQVKGCGGCEGRQ